MKYNPIHPFTYSPCVKSVSYLFHTCNFSASYIPFVAAFDDGGKGEQTTLVAPCALSLLKYGMTKRR